MVTHHDTFKNNTMGNNLTKTDVNSCRKEERQLRATSASMGFSHPTIDSEDYLVGNIYIQEI